jgi:hypothetical protein
MDERRFDELTKALVAAKPSRRVALRRLAGAALVTVFGGVALKGASAQRVGTEARTCGQGCSSNAQCNAGLQCGAGSGECVAKPDSEEKCTGNGDCPLDYETCNNNGKCVNTVGNCKECGKNGDCETGRICSNGSCIKECKDNSDCGKNKKCKNGKCVKKN